MNLENLQALFEEGKSQIINDWYELLRFKSVSTDPYYDGDCKRCAEWISGYLERHGFSSELIQSQGKPFVFAEVQSSPDMPTVLFYGHYDVQPAEPLELWETDPFEPIEKNGRIYARGAEDNKGQSLAVLSAIIALRQKGALKPNVKIIMEGEEECGSHSLSARAFALKEKLKADVLMVSDNMTASLAVPTITMGLRGIVHLELKLKGANRDLHSGLHGGVAPNPAAGLSRLLATLHDERGRIAVDGYYDGLHRASARDLGLAAGSDIDAEEYFKSLGVYPSGGEKGISLVERRGFRPTIEINGITSGYQGEGQKTIIPGWASVKLTSRIAGGQDPARCLELIKSHLRKHKPEGFELEIYDDGVSGAALMLSTESPLFKKTAEVLKELSGNDPCCLWDGASIPIIPVLSEASGAEPLLVGFGMDEDNIHAPNESFSIEQFRQCFLFAGLMLSRMAEI